MKTLTKNNQKRHAELPIPPSAGRAASIQQTATSVIASRGSSKTSNIIKLRSNLPACQTRLYSQKEDCFVSSINADTDIVMPRNDSSTLYCHLLYVQSEEARSADVGIYQVKNIPRHAELVSASIQQTPPRCHCEEDLQGKSDVAIWPVGN